MLLYYGTEEEEQLGPGAATPTACLLQRKGGSLRAFEGSAWPTGSRAWYAPAIASERLPSLMVEVEPSYVLAVLLPLVPAPRLRCADLTSWCRG